MKHGEYLHEGRRVSEVDGVRKSLAQGAAKGGQNEGKDRGLLGGSSQHAVDGFEKLGRRAPGARLRTTRAPHADRSRPRGGDGRRASLCLAEAFADVIPELARLTVAFGRRETDTELIGVGRGDRQGVIAHECPDVVE